jgi:hypothetical protein
MNHGDFNKKYRDIVFIPTVLEPPPFDLEKLHKWIKDNPNLEYEYYCTKFNLDITSKEFYDMKWDHGNYSAFFKSYYVCDYKLGWWNESFNQTFPEVLEWAKTDIPVKDGKRYQLGIVTQRSLEELKEHGRAFSSSIHTDEEDIGLRWFFNNKNNNLFFYKTKVPVDDLKKQATDEARNSVTMFNKITADTELVMNEELGVPYANDNCYSVPIKINTVPTTGWYLNQYQSAHVIAHEIDNPEKITIILDAIGNKEHKWDWERLDDMMVESLEKYKDQAIFLDDFRGNND